MGVEEVDGAEKDSRDSGKDRRHSHGNPVNLFGADSDEDRSQGVLGYGSNGPSNRCFVQDEPHGEKNDGGRQEDKQLMVGGWENAQIHVPGNGRGQVLIPSAIDQQNRLGNHWGEGHGCDEDVRLHFGFAEEGPDRRPLDRQTDKKHEDHDDQQGREISDVGPQGSPHDIGPQGDACPMRKIEVFQDTPLQTETDGCKGINRTQDDSTQQGW
jgi:hypothetical protein